MKLTPRQIEILQSVADGETTERTAFKLRIAIQTVKAHKVNIYRALKVSCAAHAVAIAFREGIIE